MSAPRRLQFASLLVVVLTSCTGGGDIESASPGASVSAATSPLTSLWPEHDEGSLAAAQSAVDANDQTAQWRIDPGQVGTRFSEQILGWTDPSVSVDQPWTPSGGTPHVRVGVCPSSGCPARGPNSTEILLLAQLDRVGTGGVWSVVSAEAGDVIRHPLDIAKIGDLTLEAGRRLDPFTMSARNGGLPDGTDLGTGTLFWGAGCTPAKAETHTLWFSYAHFQVASPTDASCDASSHANAGVNGAVFTGAPVDATDAAIARLTGASTSPDRAPPVKQLSIYAVSIAPASGRIRPLPAYLDQDPSTLPPCLLAIGAPTSDGEAIPPRPYGVGISVSATAANPPCMADASLRIDIVRGDDAVASIEGEHTAHLAGPVPPYVPGGTRPFVWWRLGDWCPPLGEGPYDVRISGGGQVFRQVPIPVLDHLCTESAAAVGGAQQPRPSEGRGTPSLDVMGGG